MAPQLFSATTHAMLGAAAFAAFAAPPEALLEREARGLRFIGSGSWAMWSEVITEDRTGKWVVVWAWGDGLIALCAQAVVALMVATRWLLRRLCMA